MRPTTGRRYRTVAACALAAALALAGVSPALAAPSPAPAPDAGASDAATAPGSTADSVYPATGPGPSAAAKAAPAPTVVPAAAGTPDPWATSPYMGWSSYSMQVFSNQGASWINADQLIAQSDAMHEKLQKAGYDHINVDSGWNKGVDANGRPTPNAELYPDGLQAVIDHVHKNGQKFGLYWIPGMDPKVYDANLPVLNAPGCTTQNIVKQPIAQADYWGLNYKIDFSNPCAQKWVDSVVQEFADWGVNFLKFDSVTPGSGVGDLSLDARDDVAAWSKALKAHQIWFELSWDLDIKYADLWREKANGWRIEWDVEAYAPGVALTQWENIARLFPKAANWWQYTGNGGYMDMDSLDVGNGRMDGMTKDERRTATTLWAMEAAPMYTGNDLTKLDQYGIDLLTNPEVVAVNQAAIPARPVSTSTDKQVWYSLQPDGSYAVALYNLGRTDSDITLNWSDIGLSGPAKVRDLWNRKNLGSADGSFTASEVPIHGVRMLKVTPQRSSTVSLNDDAKGVAYTGAWARNGGKEVSAASQPLALTVNSGGGSSTAPASDTTVVTLNDTDPAIKYQGSWNSSINRGLGDYQDDVHWSWNIGDSIEHTFTGTGIAFSTEKNTDEGEIDIYIDGVLQTSVSLYSDTRQVAQTVFDKQDLPNGVHTFKAVLKAGQFFLVDRLDVTRQNLISPTAATVDKTAAADLPLTLLRDPSELTGVSNGTATLKSGSDYTLSGAALTLTKEYLASLPEGQAQLSFAFHGDVLDDVHWTATDGDAVSYSFTGSEVSWIAPTGPDQGAVDVYVDGTKVKTVDTHSDARRTQQKLFTATKLSKKPHTIKLVKASGEVMRNDVIRFTVG